MEQKEVLLIIPAYNEEKNIGKVMDQLAQPEIAELVDVLVMNDASSDNTIWMVKQRGYAVITHVFNLGYGSGLQLGYKYAIRRGYRYVIQMAAGMPIILHLLVFLAHGTQALRLELDPFQASHRDQAEAVGITQRPHHMPHHG